MHEYVQKLTSTTLPRRALLLKGAELSQATAPSRSGIRPSSPAPEAIATTPPRREVAVIQKTRLFITKTPIIRAYTAAGRFVIAAQHNRPPAAAFLPPTRSR